MRKLRRLRAEKGLTMDALEERTGVSKRTISELERGMRSPQALTLAKLAAALGVDIDDLLEDEAPKDQAPRSLSELLERAGVADRAFTMSLTEIGEAFECLSYQEAYTLAREIADVRAAVKPVLAQYKGTPEEVALTVKSMEINMVANLSFQAIAERERGQAAAQGDLDRVKRIERELKEVA